jgi:hypothetical protein
MKIGVLGKLLGTVYVTPYTYIHLTKRNLGRSVTLLPSKGYRPSGVSFAPTIRQALNAMPVFYTGEDNFVGKKLPARHMVKRYTFYIYTPVRRQLAIIPRTADDYRRSGERRVPEPIKCKRAGVITVVSRESPKGRNIHNVSVGR